MPNLKPLKPESKESKKKSAQVLTAELLNNEIVNMRGAVAKTQRFVSSQLARTLKMLKGKFAKKPEEKMAKRVSRLEEDLKVIKTLAKDEVSKFALVNKKTKSQLSFSADTPAAERCLYHLATEKTMLKAVGEFRKKYEDAEVRTAYFLQRLGAQYQGTKVEKKGVKKEENAADSDGSDGGDEQPVVVEKKSSKSSEKQEKPVEFEDDDDDEEDDDEEEKEETAAAESEKDEDENEGEDDEDGEESDGEGMSDVDMGSDSEDEETIEKRRKMLFDLCGIKEDKSRPQIAPKPKKVAQDDDDTNAEDQAKEESSEKPKEMVDSKTLLKNIVQKTLTTEAPKSGKNLKKLKSEIKQEKKQEKAVKRPQTHETEEVSTTVVKKVKLSEGGVIELKKTAPVLEKEDSGDSDSSEAPVSSFFLSADGSSGHQNEDSSGEESVDDDANIAVTPLPKKGGEMRKMSAARQKLHAKLEKRPFERQKKMAQNRKEVMVKGANKGDKVPKPDPKVPETLHPSWAARVQKKKELEGAKPQGKRMVFDDDDD